MQDFKHKFGNSRTQQIQMAKNIKEITFDCWFDNATKRLGQIWLFESWKLWELETLSYLPSSRP